MLRLAFRKPYYTILISVSYRVRNGRDLQSRTIQIERTVTT